MSKPSLLSPGNIILQKWMNSVEKRRAQHEISLDYIMNYIIDRMPARRGQPAKIPAKIMGDRVILLKSGTGSGKSTTIPPELHKRFENIGKSIVVTEPRVLTAMDIPFKILPWHPNLEYQKNIGSQTGPIDKRPMDGGITFMTIGVLLQQLKILEDEKIMKKYMFILIDEVHERDVNIDLSLLYIKRFLERNYDNPDCPMLILMSATFEKEDYMNYFGIPKQNYIEVKGRTFPNEVMYEDNPVTDWVERSIEIVKQVHMSPEGLMQTGIEEATEEYKKDEMYIGKGRGFRNRDILIFVNGGAQIKPLIYRLNMLNLDEDFTKGGYIIPVTLTAESFYKGEKEYQNLFGPLSKITTLLPLKKQTIGGRTIIGGVGLEKIERDDVGSWYEGGATPLPSEIQWSDKRVPVVRKVIVSTNVAETGITLESLKYCIDTGFFISVEFNPTYSINTILNKNVTQGMSLQRSGRVGRNAPGIVNLLYTKEMFDMFIKDQYPSLLTTDISFSILGSMIKETESKLIDSEEEGLRYKVEYNKPFNIIDLDFLSYPSTDSIQYTLEKLYMLGFITSLGGTQAPYKKRGNPIIIPTTMGILANNIRKIKLENIRMIFAGYDYGCSILDLITITAFLEVGFRSVSTKRFGKGYEPVDILGLKNKEQIMIYYKLVFADEMIEQLFIFLIFQNFLDGEKGKKINLEKIKKWCEDHNLNYNGLMKVISFRDELLESFCKLGYNPFWNGLGLKRGSYNLLKMLRKDFAAGMQEIIKIKHCIFEGYRMNVAKFSTFTNKYEMINKKISINLFDSLLIKPILPVGDKIQQDRPHNIIVGSVNLSKSPFSEELMFSAQNISILDGFVTFDEGEINAYP